MNDTRKDTMEDQLRYINSKIKNHKKKKLLFIVPESAGDIFLSTSLLRSLSENYLDYDIYFSCKPEYKDLLKNNPFITNIIDYQPCMDNQIIMEGTGDWKGLFDISIMATVLTQRIINYLNNGQTKIALNLRY